MDSAAILAIGTAPALKTRRGARATDATDVGETGIRTARGPHPLSSLQRAICSESKASNRGSLSRETAEPEGRREGDFGRNEDDCLAILKASHESFPTDRQDGQACEPAELTGWCYLDDSDAGKQAVVLAVEGDSVEVCGDDDDERSSGTKQP
ncbi:hypothetical protein Efla_000525 [Eimeria flavescens]